MVSFHEQFPNVPSAEGHDWKVYEDDSFDFEWTDGKIVPQELINILCDNKTVFEEEEDDNDDDDATEADTMMDVVYETQMMFKFKYLHSMGLFIHCPVQI